MKIINKPLILVALLVGTTSLIAQNKYYPGNEPPLVPGKYLELPLGAIKPRGMAVRAVNYYEERFYRASRRDLR